MHGTTGKLDFTGRGMSNSFEHVSRLDLGIREEVFHVPYLACGNVVLPQQLNRSFGFHILEFRLEDSIEFLAIVYAFLVRLETGVVLECFESHRFAEPGPHVFGGDRHDHESVGRFEPLIRDDIGMPTPHPTG